MSGTIGDARKRLACLLPDSLADNDFVHIPDPEIRLLTQAAETCKAAGYRVVKLRRMSRWEYPANEKDRPFVVEEEL